VLTERPEQPPTLAPLAVEAAVELPAPLVVTAPAVLPGLRGRIVSYSSLELHATCSLRYHLEHELRIPTVEEAASGRPDSGIGGRRFGEAFHELMRGVDWREPADAAWAAAQFVELGSGANGADRERAATHYARAIGGEEARRLRVAQQVAVEEPFVLTLDGAVLTGYMDVRAVESDGSMLVVDWKTGMASPGAYELQQELYAVACLDAGASSVEVAWVFLDDPEATVRAVYPALGRQALAERVSRRLKALLDPPVPAAIERQPFCFGCPGLRAWCPVSRRSTADG
jgi:hypothetical protein